MLNFDLRIERLNANLQAALCCLDEKDRFFKLKELISLQSAVM